MVMINKSIHCSVNSAKKAISGIQGVSSRVADSIVATLSDLSNQEKLGVFKLTFGKYKTKTLEEINTMDRGYLEWLHKELMAEPEKFTDVREALEAYL